MSRPDETEWQELTRWPGPFVLDPSPMPWAGLKKFSSHFEAGRMSEYNLEFHGPSVEPHVQKQLKPGCKLYFDNGEPLGYVQQVDAVVSRNGATLIQVIVVGSHRL